MSERPATGSLAGDSLVSFPEGTRAAPGTFGRFKSGGFAAVLEAPSRAADVLPVAIVGSGKVLPRDGFHVRPGTIEIRFGAPIAVAEYGPHDRVRLARRAEAAVAALLDPAAAIQSAAPTAQEV